MILQYLRKTEVGTIETVEYGVLTADVNKKSEYIDIVFQRNEKMETRRFYINDRQIYNMWLLNDNFKTLKKLI